jgi:hypothetical protein
VLRRKDRAVATAVVLTDSPQELLAQDASLVHVVTQLAAVPRHLCPHCSTEVSIESPEEAPSLRRGRGRGGGSGSYFLSVAMNLRSFEDEVSGADLASLLSLQIQYPVHISPSPVQKTGKKDYRTLLFPKGMSSVGEQAYLDFYCGQIQDSCRGVGRGRGGGGGKVFGVCSVYLSHLLREEVAQAAHLASTAAATDTDTDTETVTGTDTVRDTDTDTNTSSSSLPFFDSWRGPAETHGRPGVSVHANDSDLCTEPVFCRLGQKIQDKVVAWQNPPLKSENPRERTCDNSKFIVYMSSLKWASIGSWLHQTTMLLQFAMCHDRILLMPTKAVLRRVQQHMQSLGPGSTDYTPHSRWIHDKCQDRDSVIDCYFKQLSSCTLDEAEYYATLNIYGGHEPFLEEALASEEKYVSLGFIPFIGSCSIGSKSWGGSFKFFEELDVGLARFAEQTKLHEWGPVHQLMRDVRSPGGGRGGEHFGAFAGTDTSPMKAQLMRYMLRPKRYSAAALV